MKHLTKDQTDILERYAQTKREAKILAEEIDTLAPQILALMDEFSQDEIESPVLGTFVKAGKRKWSYPAVVISMEEEWKDAKKDAEQRGTATYTINPYLVYHEPKPEKAQ